MVRRTADSSTWFAASTATHLARKIRDVLRASDGARLPDGPQVISVEAASSAFGSYVAVDYQFDNYGECVAEAQADIGVDF